jgi:hypothetical protein
MAEHSIAAYRITVNRRMKKDPLPLNNFDGQGSDLLKEFYGFAAGLTDRSYESGNSEKILRGVLTSGENRHLRATFGLGEYGLTSKFEERGSGSPRFDRGKTDVEIIDFRNLFVFPKDREVGIFLTERNRNRGIFSIFSQAFRVAFRKQFPGYVVDISNLAPETAIARILEEGDVKKMRLVRNRIPKETAEQYELGNHETDLGTLETCIISPKGKFLPKKVLQEVVRGDSDVSSLLVWQGVEYNDLRAEVQQGRRTRTVSVASGRTPLVTFEISNGRYDQDGNLSDDAFYAEALDVALDLSEDLSLSRQSVAEQPFNWPTPWDAYRLEVPPDEND